MPPPLGSHFFVDAPTWIERRAQWSLNLSAEVAAWIDRPGTLQSHLQRRTELTAAEPTAKHDRQRFELIGPIGPPCRGEFAKVFGNGDSAKRACGLGGSAGSFACSSWESVFC